MQIASLPARPSLTLQGVVADGPAITSPAARRAEGTAAIARRTALRDRAKAARTNVVGQGAPATFAGFGPFVGGCTGGLHIEGAEANA